MSGSGQGAEHQSHHSLRPAADHPSQQAYRQSAESLDLHHRRSAEPASSNQSVPALPDESTIRANPSAPPLKPFYSIISDTTESSSSPDTYYPRVRYIFADDDPDLLTDAFDAHYEKTRTGANDNRHGRPAAVPEAPNRPILLDLELTPDGRGYAVASATSLAADWAVADAQVQRLQASPSGDSRDGESDDTMILRVDGLGLPAGLPSVAVHPTASSPALEKDGAFPSQDGNPPHTGRDYSNLLRSFEGRMTLLQRIAHSSEGDHEQQE